MALGEYTATSWAFEALVESVKLDQMAENDNNIIRAGRLMLTDHLTEGSYSWGAIRGESGNNETHLWEINPLEVPLVLFAWTWFYIYLADKGAYDKVTVHYHICALVNPDPALYTVSTLQINYLDDSGCATATYEIQDTFDVTTTGLWSHSVDISSYDAGSYIMIHQLALNLTDRMTWSGSSIYLTRTGLGT